MAKDRRVPVILQCTSCKEQNYTTTVIRQAEEKLERMKYCPRERTRTLHVQKKISSARR